MTHRLLLVEQSATMRSVMEKHAHSLGFDVDACDTYPEASKSLEHQFQKFGADYSGVIFGWPIEPQNDAESFAQKLESSHHKDLPVVVMSTDMRPEARAWIAGRGNTAILGWKEYQDLESFLRQLIDFTPDEFDADEAESARPDNHDIHLLVVDDSATIRYSMRDLFQLHGYQVTLAATREDAMRDASRKAIDIAVLDYYLTETTGDLLCRELLASDQTGDIVCTILTGTYSDHIIKRSLRAGAAECMFKNESSELLLSRINAISKFVRQKRQLQAEQLLLEDVLEFIAGAVILINNEQRIVYVNTPAIKELGLKDKSALIGQPARTLLEPNGPGVSGVDVHAVSWTLPSGGIVEIDYQHSMIESGNYSLVRFARRSMPIASAEMVELQSTVDPKSIVSTAIEQFSLPIEAKPFLLHMQQYIDSAAKLQPIDTDLAEAEPTRVSLLLLDVFLKPEGSTKLIPLPDENATTLRVGEALKGIIARHAHVVSMGGNRYGFLLRHAEESQAYVLTRKIMQHCLETPIAADGVPGASVSNLACTGSLLGLTKNAAQPMQVLLRHAFNGLQLVNKRDPNQAILLDVRRLLRAYPDS